MESATFTPRNQYIAAAMIVAGLVVVAALAGIQDAITEARFNAAFGEPTLAYKLRIAAVAVAEFLMLAIPGLLLAIRGHRFGAFVPMAVLALGRVTAGVEVGFEAVVALVWLVLAAAPVTWLIRTATDRPRTELPPTAWVLAATAVTGVIVWYVEVIFNPDGRLTSTPAAYIALLAFGLLLGAPRGWWLFAHGLVLGLAVTANGIAYGWIATTVPITADSWSLATLVGPVLAGVAGSLAHRLARVESASGVVQPSA